MAYTPTVYVDGSAPDISATNLNKLETAASKMPYAVDGTLGQIRVANGSGGVTWKKLTASEIDAAAAIPISTLAGYPADATKYLTGLGTWVTPAVSGQLDYAQVTTNGSAITASTEGTSVALVTGNSVTYDGTAVHLTAFVPRATSAGSPTSITWVFYMDSTVIGQVPFTGATIIASVMQAQVQYTPAAGAHTFAVKAFQTGGTSWTLQAGVGGSGAIVPAFLRVAKA